MSTVSILVSSLAIAAKIASNLPEVPALSSLAESDSPSLFCVGSRKTGGYALASSFSHVVRPISAVFDSVAKRGVCW